MVLPSIETAAKQHFLYHFNSFEQAFFGLASPILSRLMVLQPN
jgi:hypothetical protein